METALSPSATLPASNTSPHSLPTFELTQEVKPLESPSPIHSPQASALTFRIATLTDTCQTTPLFHELLSISVASAFLSSTTQAQIYTDSKQALKLAQQASNTLSPAFTHLPYGPILATIRASPHRPQLHWVISHPENHAPEPHWTTAQRGIHRADLLAKLSTKARTFLLPNDHLHHIDLHTFLDHIMPTGTWMWFITDSERSCP
jgi:hypothetical protein